MSRASVVPAASTGHVYRSSEDRNVGRCIVLEQPGQSISSAPVETSVGAEGASSGAEGARAAISNAPAEPRWLDVANVGRCGVFMARPSQLIELISAWNVEAVNIYSVELRND